MGLAERPPAFPAAVAALAPHKLGPAPTDGQIAHAHPWPCLDLERAPPAARTAARASGQLDLEVELTIDLPDAFHLDAL
jgi:hypothetical protein